MKGLNSPPLHHPDIYCPIRDELRRNENALDVDAEMNDENEVEAEDGGGF